MKTTPGIKNSTADTLTDIQFSDIFILEDIQRLQNLFSDATGVASVITYPDGTPITNPSNFCHLCNNIIRKTEKGRTNCFISDATIGRQNTSGPIVQPCLSGGLWDAGASITVGGKHIANWLIGQVRNEEVDVQRMIQYSDEIGATREDFIEALNEVPIMSVEQFNKVSKMLFAFANELSEKAYNNFQLKMQVAEREKAANLLQESEERFQLLFNKAPLGYQSLDFDGNFIEVNQQWLDTLGFTREEVIGKWFGDFLSPMYQEGFLKRFPIFKAKGKIHSEFEMVHKNGHLLFIAFNGKIGYDLNGEFKQTHCILQDVTERKQAEEELRESQSLYHSFIEQLPIAVFRKDREGRYVLVNSQFCRLKELKQEDLIGRKPSEVAASEIANQGEQGQATKYADSDEDMHELILQTGKSFETEEEYPATDGGKQYMHIMRMPVLDSHGKIIGTQGIMFDITERKQVEKQLKLLSRAIEQSPVTVMITSKEGLIEYVNPKFTELTGYTIDEIKGKNPRFGQSGKQTREFYEKLWNTILSGNYWQGEFHNKKKNGDSYWESATISSILNSQGDISFFIAVKEDITEKKKMVEDLIKAKEKAEESDNLKTAFLNNISHEIRTPFNGILGFLAIIQDENLSASERDEYISIINKSAYRLMKTINDIVEISQIQAGQMNLIITKTNIRRLTSELYSRFKTDAESKGLKFYINNDLPNNIECIYTDGIKLNTILTILIGNAIKFTKAGSIVFGIMLKAFSATGAAGEPVELEFSVKDTGIGISENNQPTIFELFIQADISNTRQFEGSGLGLSIAKAYVEMLGGKICVESEMGNGAEFYFTIPYNYELEENNVLKNVASADISDNQIKDIKILIVEDDEGSAVLITIAVRKFGKEVIKVRTGIEAVEACRNNPDFDLVLMDIKMPGIDGYEATRQIRQFNKDVVIIAQTAYALTGDREMAIEAGCNDYITKPIKKDKLSELMMKYFKK